MTITARWKRSCFVVVAAALTSLSVAACEEDGNPFSAVCCTEFKVGADLSSTDFGLEGEVRGQFLAFAQASSDLAATAAAALNDVQTACRNVAVELGASEEEIVRAEQEPERERTTELCRLAVAQIKARVTARVELDVAFQPPVCEIAVQAKARCEAACSASGTCNVRVNPPICKGGRLEIVCKGECTAKGEARLYCEGSCTGNCEGTCTAQGGVRCNGRCEGTCTAEGSATGQAFDAQGNCIGTCQGTCSATPPGVRCEGSCKGQCDATCRAEANATVTCDGQCSGDYEPLRCQGGTLEGGCKVEGSCNANCEASATARAECRPPEVVVKARAAVDPELARYLKVLERNLPPLLVVLKARGQTFVDIAARVASSAGSTGSAAVSGRLGVRATACLFPIATTIGEAAVNAKVSVEASANVVGSMGVR